MREQRTIVVNVGKRVKQSFEKLAYAWFIVIEKSYIKNNKAASC